MSTQQIIDGWEKGDEPYRRLNNATTKHWRNEALRWLKRYRKTNFYSHWENYQTCKILAFPTA